MNSYHRHLSCLVSTWVHSWPTLPCVTTTHSSELPGMPHHKKILVQSRCHSNDNQYLLLDHVIVLLYNSMKLSLRIAVYPHLCCLKKKMHPLNYAGDRWDGDSIESETSLYKILCLLARRDLRKLQRCDSQPITNVHHRFLNKVMNKNIIVRQNLPKSAQENQPLLQPNESYIR